MTPSRRRMFVCLLLTFVSVQPLRAQQQPAPQIHRVGNAVYIDNTLEAAVGQPRIHVRISRNGRPLQSANPLQGLDLGLEDLLGAAAGPQTSFIAYLDTGASAYVLSESAANRFDITIDDNAIYHEVGLHGETPMGVTQPYELALADSNGLLNDQPGQRFHPISRNARMQLNKANLGAQIGGGDAEAAALMAAMTEVNVIGMPAIQDFLVEVDPTPMGNAAGALAGLDPNQAIDPNADLDALLGGLQDIGAGPAVRLTRNGRMPRTIDLIVPLAYVDFNRHKNPRDRGAKPDLAPNPMVQNIETKHGNNTFQGDWLLDTGATVSIISQKHARKLGLLNTDPAFTLPIGGIGGGVQNTDGYIIEQLTIPAAHGKQIVYRNARAIVHDISITLDDGSHITLDGVFGMNLLLPTMAGIATGFPTAVADAPFTRIYIDGPHAKLGLTLRKP